MDCFGPSWNLYNTPDQKVRASLDYLQLLGYTNGDGRYRVERERFSSLLVGRVLSGTGVLHTRGRTCRVKKGQIFFLDCTQPHRYHPEEDEWRFDWIHIYGPNIRDFLAWHQEELPLAYGGNKTAWLAESMDKLFFLMHEEGVGTARDIAMNGHILIILGILGTLCRKDVLLPPSVQKAQGWMQKHYSEPLSLDALSAEVSLSKYHLIKLFRRYLGETPGKYFTKIRIEKSKHLLENTRLSVEEIATSVGFSDASSYIRCFKVRENSTPARFRSEVFGITKQK